VKALSGKEFCRVLRRHGWKLDHISKSSHHIYKKVGMPVLSVPVHAGRTLGKGLQAALMKKAGLTDADL
jgi:predicted RNA binding protein YcfA (HicA-like mRNA interferase family)